MRLGVLFDMDGVLVDSYTAHRDAWQSLAEQEGLAYSTEDFTRTFGRTSRETIVELWPMRASETEELDSRKEALYRHFVEKRFTPIPGAKRLIKELHAAGLSLAVASSGPPENVDLVLALLGERKRFAVTVTGRDTARGKPDPEVFLLAARRLEIPPAQCVVIEDAPVGVEAAHAAEMAAIALLSTGRRKEDFLEAVPEYLATSLLEITPNLITSLAGKRIRRASLR